MSYLPQTFAGLRLATLLLLLGLALPAQAQDDFWSWLGPQLKLSQLEHTAIDQWEARYRRRHLELEVILQDGKEFLYPLALAVADRGMPLELALLPIIESHLDPTAVSSSGARGLWQFLPRTAEHLGLKHDWWQDESADYLRSTTAALDYLDYLHDRFGGWMLALAAYNAGEGRVWKEMQNSRRSKGSMDLWDLDLPRQTQVYVPKLLALARILRDPRGVKLPALQRLRSFTRVSTPRALDVAQIAELADISIEHVYRLNPQWLRWTMAPDGPYSVYVPTSHSARFRQALKQLPSTHQRYWHRHTVKSGESLGQIAQDHDTSVKLLRQLNRVHNERIKAGNTLLVAEGSRQVDKITRDAVRHRRRLDYAPRLLPQGLHRVTAGDSLWSIARLYDTTVRRLQRDNDLRGSHALVPGQLLKTGRLPNQQNITYTVRKGDMLSLIAQRHGISVREIRQWNQLDGSLIKPGQQLDLHL